MLPGTLVPGLGLGQYCPCLGRRGFSGDLGLCLGGPVFVVPVGLVHPELTLADAEIFDFSHSFRHFRGQNAGFGVDLSATGAVT